MKQFIRLLGVIILAGLVVMGCEQQEPIPTPTSAPGPTLASPTPATAAPAVTASPAPTPTPLPTPTVAPGEGLNPAELLALLPEEIGFTWTYDGSLEAGHELTLQAVEAENGVKSFSLTGMVAGESSEADLDRRIQLRYTVDGTVWVQEKSAVAMLENRFDRIEILRAPLAVGDDWRQSAENAQGEMVELVCTLESVMRSGQKTVYAVRYEDPATGYYERREITSGVGVTAFERTAGNDEGLGPIGYWLTGSQAPVKNASVTDWLPPLGQTLSFSGDSSYGHSGSLIMEQENDHEIVYRFDGVYEDAIDAADAFVIRYYYDKDRLTMTEMAVSNERTGEAEVNSILHNVVLLRFPLSEGAVWAHDTLVDGQRCTVEARIVSYDEEEGRVRVRYSVEGVPGYYDDTYIEERTFTAGKGMTAFSKLTPGDLDLDPEPKPMQIQQALSSHMFSYAQEDTAGTD